MSHKPFRWIVSLLIGLIILFSVGGAVAQGSVGTAFTYQGHLTSGGSPANGLCAFEFGLWDAPTGGNLLGTVTNNSVPVANGLFTVQLDFGNNVFTGAARWLEVKVGCIAGAGATDLLSPRQELTAAPYALYASSAGSVSQATNFDVTNQLTVGGNVGLGTMNPVSRLHIKHSGIRAIDGLLLERSDATNTWFLVNSNDNKLHIAPGPTPTQSGAATMVLTDAGNVGIGTTSPSAALHINNPAVNWVSWTRPLIIGGDENVAPAIQLGYGGTTTRWGIGTNYAGSFFNLFTANSDGGSGTSTVRFLVTSAGNVGIGTINPSRKLTIFSDGEQLQLDGSGAGSDSMIRFTNQGNFRMGLFYRPNVDALIISDDISAAIKFRFRREGSLVVERFVFAESFETHSDARLKTNVSQLTQILEKLDKIRGVSFVWNSEAASLGLSDEQEQIGVLAQEVEAVFPELVNTSIDGYKTIDYGKLSVVLIEGVKELRAEKDAEIAALKADNAALEQRVAALEQAAGINGESEWWLPNVNPTSPVWLFFGGLLVIGIIVARRRN